MADTPGNIGAAIKRIDAITRTRVSSESLDPLVTNLTTTVKEMQTKLHALFDKLPSSLTSDGDGLASQFGKLTAQINILKELIPMAPVSGPAPPPAASGPGAASGPAPPPAASGPGAAYGGYRYGKKSKRRSKTRKNKRNKKRRGKGKSRRR